MKVFKKIRKLNFQNTPEKITTQRLIVFKCVGFTYPYYLLLLLKIFLIALILLTDILYWYFISFYGIVLIILMYLDLNYFNKNLQKKIIAIYPKIEETDLKIDVRPSLRIKNLTIILLLNSLLYFALILTKSKEQTLEEIISFIVLSLFFSLLFGFIEYVCCIHCKPDIIVEPVQVFEYKHQGKSLISIKNLDQEYRQLVDNINEKALGYIYLDENDEFELKLIHLKSKLNTYNSKFENITLESIFITGLVLSAFFTIITTIEVSILKNTFNEFINNFSILLNSITNKSNNKQVYLNLFNLTKNEFFTLISIITLICSTFYILVLIMRLRINHIYVNATSAMSELVFLNDKCKILNSNDVNFYALVKKREFTMKTVVSLVNTLNTTNEFISLYRMFGILAFYLIIVISTFQINFYFGLAISVFTVITHVIKKTEEIFKLEKIRNLIKKYQ